MRILLVLLMIPLAGCLGGADGPSSADPSSPEPECAMGPVTSHPGPGPGLASLLWDHVEGATGYEILLGDKTVNRLDHMRATTVKPALTGTTFAVRPVGCQGEAVAVLATPLPGQMLEVGLAPREVTVSEQEFEVLDLAGQAIGKASWRLVQGTGNCCENYVATDRDGTIYDFGGTFLHFSKDEGLTWQTVGTPVPYVTGEGAVVQAPNGDIVGVGWDPYSGDQLWSHKYDVASGTWSYQTTPVHTPFYDRPWLATIEGPFILDGLVAPYLTIAISNFGNAVIYLSYDGLNYVEAQQNELSALLGNRFAWPEAGFDGSRDWIQPQSESLVASIGEGFGVRFRGNDLGCDWAAVQDGAWGCTDDIPVGRLFVDASGARTVIARDGDVFVIHQDGPGMDWTERRVPLPAGIKIEDWDAKVHSAYGIAIAVHGHRDGVDVDLLVRSDDATSYYQVGAGDAEADAGLGGSRRFDFANLGFLPEGRIVMSFTDGTYHPPALAIQK